MGLLSLWALGCPEQPASPKGKRGASARRPHAKPRPPAPSSASRSRDARVGAPAGLYALIRFGQQPRESTWSKDFVDGVVFRTYWRSFYSDPRKKGSLAWDQLDAVFDAAAAQRKKVRLMVVPGFYSPDWVLSAVRTAEFTVPQGPDKGKLSKLPIPWDDEYLELWGQFVRQLADRYASRPELSWISVTGPGSHNGEVALPRAKDDTKRWHELIADECEKCRDKNARGKWLARRLLDAYEKMADQFDKAFGARKRYYTLALIHKPLPVKGRALQSWYYDKLIELTEPRPYLGLQSNGFDGRDVCPARDGEVPEHWTLIQKQARRRFTGFQTRYTENLLDCDVDKDGKVGAADRRAILEQTADNAFVHGGRFLEVYEPLFHNPNLEPVLRKAHRRLKEQAAAAR